MSKKVKAQEEKAAAEDPLADYKVQIESLIKPVKIVGGFPGKPRVVNNDNCYKVLVEFAKQLDQQQMHEILVEHLHTPAIYNFISWVIAQKSDPANEPHTNSLLNKIITEKSTMYKDGSGWTHLHWAVSYHNNSITKLLLNLKANPDVKDMNNKDCLTLAKQYKNEYPDIFSLIKEHHDLELAGDQNNHDDIEAQ